MDDAVNNYFYSTDVHSQVSLQIASIHSPFTIHYSPSAS
jgi:hypothetical protein